MNILLTGGCGYVGSTLTPRLLQEGHHVTVVDIMWFGNYLKEHKNLKVVRMDIRDTASIPMDGIDAIIHLANIANDPSCDLNAKLAWEVNTLATMQIVEKAIKSGVRQFIYASSGSVYGVKDEPEVTEDLELVPISDYNKTKMISERVLLSYKDSIILQIVRPATICGVSPRMRLDLSVNMLTMQALTKGEITVFGGNQTRPNIHLKDMIEVYSHFLAGGESIRGIYNAGFENMSIMTIAETVKEYTNAKITVTESNDPRSYRLNSDKLLGTGFRPRQMVRDAIREVMEAYKAGTLQERDEWYSIKTLKSLSNLA
ncbi:MAG: NAD-dependent epimerase/dehydratase [Spirochaetae bacterium HGW-Spirochaetae-1]|jgi:nucleoside-diphosphate-sugar epimerase|nr:MAG: NAD-dependent epimerase/dehydratase [Spirochaetae bacterium HGW-Spirochaetae-1]